jgi:hypothetical protein
MFMRLLSLAAIASALTVEPAEQKTVSLKMIPGYSFDAKGQDCHYADPYQQQCKPDELAAEIQAKPNNLKICVSKCDEDTDCPTDTW